MLAMSGYTVLTVSSSQFDTGSNTRQKFDALSDALVFVETHCVRPKTLRGLLWDTAQTHGAQVLLLRMAKPQLDPKFLSNFAHDGERIRHYRERNRIQSEMDSYLHDWLNGIVGVTVELSEM